MPQAKSPYEAIADPTRRSILDSLMLAGPKTAGDLARQFPQMSRPAVSKHLRVLRAAQLVRQKTQGREIWYEFNPAPLFRVQDWLDHYQGYWEDRLLDLKKSLETNEG